MTAQVVVVAGTRGGSMSTSLVANLAGLVARAGNRTLLVALDRHADVALDLGTTTTTDPSVRTVRPGLDLLTAGTRPPSEAMIARAVERAREEYDLVLVDGSGGDRALSAMALRLADWWLVVTRPDRAARGSLSDDLAQVSESATSPRVIGVVVAGASGRPRTHLARARSVLGEHLGPDRPVFLAAVRSATGIAWWARERGVLVHELVAEIDREFLAEDVVEEALRLGRDYRDVAAELLARIDQAQPV